MKKILFIIGAVALIVGLGWSLWPNAESAAPSRVDAQALKKRIREASARFAAERRDAGEAVSVSESRQKADAAQQEEAFLKRQAEDASEAAKTAPASRSYPGKPALAYRESREPPKTKGGKETVLREWLIKPSKDGYVNHLEEEYAETDSGELKLVGRQEYVANQIIATIDGEVVLEDFKAELARQGAEVRRVLMTLEKGARLVTVMTPEITFDSVSKLVAAAGKTTANPVTSLDVVRRLNRTPNDTYYSQQWGLAKICAPTVWEYVRDASPTVVAVVDSGVYYKHEDLKANMWQNPQTGRYDGLTGDTYGMRCFAGKMSGDPTDGDGHGTHCAGIIGAVGNNSKGVSGVAWTARIMAIRITNDDWSECYVSDMATGMDYARAMGAKILSCSFGGEGYNSAEYSAFNAMRTAGILCVCAAGNGGDDGVGDNNDSTPQIPASYDLDNIISVAATQSSDALASFSNYGLTSVDIAAPGVSIGSTYNRSTSDYVLLDGTSMATPFVSGAAALVWSYYPDDTYAQVAQRIYAAGQTVSSLSKKIRTGKRLSLSNIITATPSAPMPSATRGTYADKVTVSWSAVSGASHYKVWRATTSTGTKTALSDWQTATVCNDKTGAPGTGYYYFVQAATSSSGANASAYSDGAYGYRSEAQTYPDSWDPGDDTASGATVLSVSGTLQTHGPHGLNESDVYDYFKFTLTGGRGYAFESTGNYDVYGEIFDSSNTRLAYNDDGGTNKNFKITFTPGSTATYILRVRKHNTAEGGTVTYQLKYQSIYPDSWDPADNTAAGGTVLTPTTSVQTTPTHGLNAYDYYDFYAISMTAGKTYRLESTGACDMYGELFCSQTASSAYRVAYDDDTGDGSNFKIVYTPSVSQTYYLRVRRRVVGTDGTYALKYSMTVSETHDLTFYRRSEWDAKAFLTNESEGNAAMTSFTTADKIYSMFAFVDAEDNEITEAITNVVAVFDTTSETNVVVMKEVGFNGLQSGHYWWSRRAMVLNPGKLKPGKYIAFFYLNYDERIAETDTDNNCEMFEFTVTAPETTKTLESLAIVAPSTMIGGTSTNLACRATYSDGTSEQVTSVTWSITDGDDYAVLDGSQLRALEVEDSQTVRLTVSYTLSGVTKTASQEITVTPAREDPYGQPVQYPNPTMTVMARVRLDGQLAAAGTVLYAFVGSEVRGRIELASVGMQAINVFVAQAGESITFRAWDPVSGDIYVCNDPLSAVAGGSEGSPSAPYEVACFSSDPFGVVQQYPNPPMTVVAQVSIFEVEAALHDMVGVFCGDELRGKGAVTLVDGKAIVTLTVQVKSAGEQLTFRVWDASEETLHNARGFLTAEFGGSAGTPAEPYELSVASAATQVVTLRSSGWQFVSINVQPEDNSPEAVFGDVTGRIDRVACGSEVYNPAWPQAYNTLSAVVPGKAYWVKVKDSVTSAITFSVEGMPADTARTDISLAAGWNAIGYVPQQAGETRGVLANFLATDKILRVSGGNYSFDPTWPDAYNTLTVMQPGIGYWINASEACSATFVEPTGDAAARVAASLQATDFEGPWDPNDLDRDPTPATTIMGEVKLFGAKTSYGDAVVAVFADGATKPCAVQKVNVLGGVTLSFCKYPGVHLSIKVWDAYTGAQYDADTSLDLTVETAGDVIESDIVVSGEAPRYEVVFDLRGVSGGSGTRTGGGALTQQVSRCEAAVAPEVLGDVGYEFVTWDSAAYEAVKCDLIVHACYNIVEVEKVTVAFNAQGGTACPSREYCVGRAYGELPVPERDDYDFVGWRTAPDGAGDAVTVETKALADVTCLYASWTVAAHTFTNTVDGVSVPVTRGEKVVLTPEIPEVTDGLTNVVCVGWTGTGDVVPGVGTQCVFTVTQASSLAWLYQTNYWFEASASSGGAVVVADSGFAADVAGCWVPRGTNVVLEATGDMSLFHGWRDRATGTVLSEMPAYAFVMDAPCQIEAWFGVRAVTEVTLDANGGKGAADTVFVTNGLALPPLAAAPQRTGYAFAGYDDARTDGVRYYGADLLGVRSWDKEDATATLYAQWTPISYAIAFDANGGEGTMESVGLAYDVRMTLPACAFVNGRMKFKGWSLTADGRVAYADRASVSNLTDVDGEVVKLYAVWSAAPDGFAFEDARVSTAKGGSLILIVAGGSDTAAASVKLEVAYANAKAGDLNLADATVRGGEGVEQTGIKFPLVLSWKKGDTEPKTVTVPVTTGKATDSPKFLTWNLSGATGLAMGTTSFCVGEIEAGVSYAGSDVCVLPYVTDTLGGKVSRGVVVKDGKSATLKATANKGYWFAGWYDASGAWASGDAAFKVTPDDAADVAVYEARFVEAQDDLAGTYSGFAHVNLKGLTLVKGADTSSDVYGDYAFTATLSTAGKVSGSVTVGGKKVAFKGDACFDCDDAGVSFLVVADEKVWFGAPNTETLRLSFDAMEARLEGWTHAYDYAPLGDVASYGVGYRDLSKDKIESARFAEAGFAGLYAGYVDLGDGRIVPLSVNIDAKGKVKVAGRFWDGTALSASGFFSGVSEIISEASRVASAELVFLPKALGNGSYHLSLTVTSNGESSFLTLEGVATAYTNEAVDSENASTGSAFPYAEGCWVSEVGADADLCAVTLSFEGETLTIPCTVKNGKVTGLGKSSEAGVTVNFYPKTGILSVVKKGAWTIQGVLSDYDAECSAAGYRSADGEYAPACVSVGVLDMPEEYIPWQEDGFALKVGETVDEAFQPEIIAPDGSSVTWSVSGLPSGLKFDKAAGAIVGAPTKAGSYTVTVSYTYVARKVSRVTKLVVD